MAVKTYLNNARKISLFLIVLTFSATAHAKIIYVDDDAPADFNIIQAAIDDSNDGDTIIVAEGRYFENINFNGKNITLTSTDPCDPEVVAATIIDGNNNGSVVTFNYGEDANSLLVGLTITNGYATDGGGIYCENSSPTINNCTITGNTASDDGGGIYCNNSSPTLTNCTFSRNSADRDGGGMNNWHSNPTLINCTFSENLSDYGGGMENDYSSPTLTNCMFTKNSTYYYDGGGIYNYGGTPELNNCTFNGNSADYGGGMCNWQSKPTLTNCTFSGNSAYYGSGMYNDKSSPVVTNSTFTGNSADAGGGMYNRKSSPTLNNCTFTDNSTIGVHGTGDGGGMYNYYSSPTLTNCAFSGNSAPTSGGGMYNLSSSPIITYCTFSKNSVSMKGGGMCNWQSSTTLTNCIFRGNSASRSSGGGMFNYGSSPTLTYCTFCENWAQWNGGAIYNDTCQITMTNCLFSENLAQAYGGAMFNSESHLILTNCTFSGNIAFFEGGGIYINRSSNITVYNCILWENEWEIYLGDGSFASVQYTNIQSGQNKVYVEPDCELIWGRGNIDADPCFVRPGYSQSPQQPNEPPLPMPSSYIHNNGQNILTEFDYHLLPASPCINAGDPNYVVAPNETDLDGNLRVIGCRIDMGAFEYGNFVPAELRIIPRNINLANKAKSFTAYLWLPENYNIADIELCVLLLEDQIQAESVQINNEKRVIVAGFTYEQLKEILDVDAGNIELTIKVQLMDATYLEGTDVIKVIHEGGGKLAKFGKAIDPNPADGATDVDTTAYLSWTAGFSATSHDVYFGTSSSPPFVCNQTAATFDPGTMATRTKYFWRIDEVNKWGKTTGDLWNFTTLWRPPPPPPM